MPVCSGKIRPSGKRRNDKIEGDVLDVGRGARKSPGTTKQIIAVGARHRRDPACDVDVKRVTIGAAARAAFAKTQCAHTIGQVAVGAEYAKTMTIVGPL